MEREFISVGIKVIPHSKSYCGNLESSVNWNHAIMINQPYLFVSSIYPAYIVLDSIEGSNGGDYFLPEDFEPYIEESESVKMSNYNKGDLVQVVDGSYSLTIENGDFRHSYGVELTGRDFEILHTELKLPSTDKDQFNTMILKAKDIGQIVYTQERMVKPVEKVVPENTVQNITINITIDSKMDINNLMRELSSKIKNISNY